MTKPEPPRETPAPLYLRDEGELQILFSRLKSEAEWGLRHSQTHRAQCNAQRALEVMLALLRGEIR